jgi:hypothetical protein
MAEPKQKEYHGKYSITISGVPRELLLWVFTEAENECLTVSQYVKRMLLAIMREKANQKTAEAV